MTLTVRSATVDGATTKGSALTHAEMDANWAHVIQSSNQSFVPSGTGATSSTVQTILRSLAVTPQMYGAVADGTTDDTTALNNAITYAASAGKALFIPAGTYKATSTLTTIAGQITIFGEGPFKSIIKFAPTAADTLFYLDNGVSKVTHVVMRDFGIYSTDTTYAKVGIDGRDLSVCFFERLYIRGTGMASGPGAGAGWSDTGTSGSIGIRFQGRESVSVIGVEIIADKPIYFAANPNTSATDGEDCDHFHFQDLYLVGNGNYLVEVAAGLGASELVFDGYQAWVGGTGGFKINDTRAAPNVTSRGIKFKNIRTEQITDSAGYAFNMVFTAPALTVKMGNTLMASGSNGITINGCQRLVLDQVIAAQTTGTSIVTAGMNSSSVVTMRNCNWTTGGAVTLTGLTQIIAEAYRSASYAAPSDAVYAGQITDTRVNVEKMTATSANSAVGLLVTGATGDALQVLPQAGGSGATLRGVNNAQSDFTPLNFTYSQMNWSYRTGVATTGTGMIANSAGLQHSLRHQEKQGANVTAANNLTLGGDGNYFQIDGTTQVNLMANTNWQGGAKVTLKFNTTPTVKHNQAASGNNKPILLAGAVDFVATANDTLTLQYDSTDAVWYEVSRAVI